MAAKLNLTTVPSMYIPNICHLRDPPHFSLVSIFKVQTQPRAARGLQRTFIGIVFLPEQLTQKPNPISGRTWSTAYFLGLFPPEQFTQSQSQPRVARGLKRTLFAHFLARTIQKPNPNLGCIRVEAYFLRTFLAETIQLKSK